MCGICACIGDENQIDNVLNGLKTLEYRGYDSCGISYLEKNKTIVTTKTVGQVENLKKKTKEIFAKTVIGHTRWATHGVVSEQNAHPHLSFDGTVALVHNGIIENFKELKREYLENINLKSQTDTEVVVNLIALQNGTNLEKIASVCKILKGSYAFCVLFENENCIYLAKKASPLYVANNEKRSCCAGDISAFGDDFCKFNTLEDGEFAVVKNNEVQFFDSDLKNIKKTPKNIEKNDFFIKNNCEKNCMIKEIQQQPNVLKLSYFKYIKENIFCDEFIEKIKKFKNVCFIGCGTAYHSALLGVKYFEKFTKMRCESHIASEFRYSDCQISDKTLYILISQSGETADTIACAKHIKQNGAFFIAVTNVAYCSLNCLADYVIPTFAGVEYSVASTKAYTAQIFALLCLAIKISGDNFADEIKNFVINFDVGVEFFDFSKEILKFKKIYFIGRGQDFVTSVEASLKLSEITYTNCNAFPAGELKHGYIALVDENSLFFVISTKRDLKEKIESNIQEIKARGGKVFLLSNFIHNVEVDYFRKLDDFDECFMPIVSIVPMQKLAYELCIEKNLDPDKPRNLAKSVTVE